MIPVRWVCLALREAVDHLAQKDQRGFKDHKDLQERLDQEERQVSQKKLLNCLYNLSHKLVYCYYHNAQAISL